MLPPPCASFYSVGITLAATCSAASSTVRASRFSSASPPSVSLLIGTLSRLSHRASTAERSTRSLCVFMDVMLAVPSVMPVIVICGRPRNRRMFNLILAIGIASIPSNVCIRSCARPFSRSAIREYIEARASAGCSDARMILSHILRTSSPPSSSRRRSVSAFYDPQRVGSEAFWVSGIGSADAGMGLPCWPGGQEAICRTTVSCCLPRNRNRAGLTSALNMICDGSARRLDPRK